jgi:hypothetical protein
MNLDLVAKERLVGEDTDRVACDSLSSSRL